ncbi:hypothetical protein BKA61DRAFT_303176 [Leptodontidium sp. MPI-SDFR-AT-0119]|nr:hypothetical protein BKA61DRAFT_303176 [Leptodontidium sp. MPI-SDFR-AT-0119]
MGHMSKLPASKSNPDRKTIKCDYEAYDCQSYFSRARDMTRHKSEFHQDPKKCPWCKYSAKRDGRLWEHLRDEHEPRSYTTQPRNLPVPEPPENEAQIPNTRPSLASMDLEQGTHQSDSGHWSRGNEGGQSPGAISQMLGQIEGSDRPERNYPMDMARDSNQVNQQTISLPATTLNNPAPTMSWARPLDTPPGPFASPNTFEYNPSSHVPHGTDVNSYSQTPQVASNQGYQLPIRQCGNSLQPDHVSGSFLTPLQGQSLDQQSFNDQNWVAPVNPTSQYGSFAYNDGYQRLEAAPPSFTPTAPATPGILQPRVPRSMPSTVPGVDGSWRAHEVAQTSSTESTAGNYHARPDQDSTYSNEFGGWGIDD